MFRSNQNTTCAGCGAPIAIGDSITWSRKSAGVFHPSCHPSRVRVITAPPSVPSPSPIAPVAIETRPTIEEISQGYVQKPIPSITPTVAPDEAYTLPEFKALSNTSPWWDVLAQCTRVLDRILLVGPPSSGKSTTGMKTLNIKHRITMTQSTSREDMCGMFHLISGQTVWIDGPVTKAMRFGQPVLIDEIDRCGPEVESLMYSVIDDKPHLTLPNGELVNAVAGFKVIMTSNVSPDALEDAVRDRMQAIILAYEPHIDALRGLSATESTLVRNYYKTLTQPRLTLPPTVRRMRAFKTLTDAKIPARIAMHTVFGMAATGEIQSVVANLEAMAPVKALDAALEVGF
jgi:hypothetical protein